MELTWEELEMVHHDSGRPMFKSELRRRKKDGTIETKPVRVWIPAPADSIQARVDARVWFKDKSELDADRDKDLFDEMEQLCLLAKAIRTDKAPHGQEMDAHELALWDEGPIKDIQERINIIKVMLDPRDPVESEEQFWAATLNVAKRGNIGPLADMLGHEQNSYIVRMARQACFSPKAPSSVQSFASSILERSASLSSSES